MYINLFLALISLCIALILGNYLVKLFKSLKFTQAIREKGPSSHKEKKINVPTMGGLIFLVPLFLIILVFCYLNGAFLTLDLIVVLSIVLIMATLGFVDDFLKIKKKHNKGVSGWIKLLLQLFVSVALYYIYKEGESYLYIAWFFFVIAGSTNSYNLTDGLDGLLGSISLASMFGLVILLNQVGKIEIVSLLVVFSAAILGFLYFNCYPAKIFMGDTGSLAIGGAVGASAIISGLEWFLVFFAAVPIIETLSVIVQVVSCQYSKRFLGKDIRILKMAPLHHHFELCGLKETTIVTRFFWFQVVCTVIGIIVYSY